MKTLKMNVLFSLLAGLCLVSLAHAQATNHATKADAEKSAGKGITFKIPDGVMPLDWKGFKGMLMLYRKRPGGIFVSYPNEKESIPELKSRAAAAIATMFVHDEKKSGELTWQLSSMPAHRGDKGELADVKLYDSEVESLQIVLYERERNGLTLIYGHFARKSKTSKDKDDSTEFLDQKGKGSPEFDKFWKTFPE
jgi:hypothetical protein